MTKAAVAMHSPAMHSAAPSPTSSIGSIGHSQSAGHNSAKSKLLLFAINLAGGRTAFRCGQKVAGWVTVETRGPVYAASYQIECVGYSEVPEAGSGNSRRLFHRNHLALKENLLPISRLLEKRCFEFQLPRWLPHSVECDELGSLRYCCRAMATFSGSGDSTSASAEFDDAIEAVCYFTVIEDVDLNSLAVAQRCRFDEVSCTSVDNLISKLLKDEVKASLMLKKDAYVPGENVYCQLSVHSTSNTVPVQKIVIRLVQRTTALGGGNRQVATRSRFVLQEQVASDTAEESGKYWSAKHKLHIPGVVPTTLPNSHFQHPIIVEYAVQMCVSLGFTRVPVKELTLDCPIVIGTVPKLESPTDHPLEASFVESSRCDIPSAAGQRERRLSKSGFLAPFHSKRETSGYRSPQLQCTLYCVYYPTISIYRKKQSGGLKSILKVKHSSMDDLDAKGTQLDTEEHQDVRPVSDHSRPPGMKRSTSLSMWYETPL